MFHCTHSRGAAYGEVTPVSVCWFYMVEACVIIHMSLYMLSHITAWTKGRPLLPTLRNSGRFLTIPLNRQELWGFSLSTLIVIPLTWQSHTSDVDAHAMLIMCNASAAFGFTWALKYISIDPFPNTSAPTLASSPCVDKTTKIITEFTRKDPFFTSETSELVLQKVSSEVNRSVLHVNC